VDAASVANYSKFTPAHDGGELKLVYHDEQDPPELTGAGFDVVAMTRQSRMADGDSIWVLARRRGRAVGAATGEAAGARTFDNAAAGPRPARISTAVRASNGGLWWLGSGLDR